ncbi:MAG: hypothetical protein DI535_14350 [Citrobacter freundii]|nr:MAG: hypothetical protein DI535_14350 [Citrobacter freundii]
MPAGHYNILHSQDKTELIAELASGAQGIPPVEQQRLLMDISSTLAVLQQMYSIDSISFKKAFDQLFYLAKIGLEGINAQPEMAAAMLKQLKKEVVDQEAGKVKNNYLRGLGKRAAMLGILPLVGGTGLHFIDQHSLIARYIDLPGTANMLILWSGTMLGVWLSFAITRVTLEFEDLAIVEKDRLEPLLRLLFTGGLAMVFGLLFIKKAVVIELGELSSVQAGRNHLVAFLMGVLLGVNERGIGRVLWRKVGPMIKEPL